VTASFAPEVPLFNTPPNVPCALVWKAATDAELSAPAALTNLVWKSWRRGFNQQDTDHGGIPLEHCPNGRRATRSSSSAANDGHPQFSILHPRR